MTQDDCSEAMEDMKLHEMLNPAQTRAEILAFQRRLHADASLLLDLVKEMLYGMSGDWRCEIKDWKHRAQVAINGIERPKNKETK